MKSLKGFLKSFSIYGLIPIFGKFVGILLLPLYTRLLSPEDYGAQDILVQLVIFMTFLINMEMYSGVGRLFYERDGLRKKRFLVSTGLISTLAVGIVVIVLALLFRSRLYSSFFQTDRFMSAFNIALLWAPVSAIYTYFLVIMRYEQKPKLYFILVNVQLLVRIMVSIYFVAVLRYGVFGVLVGNLVAEASAIAMFAWVLRKYISFSFKLTDLAEISKFTLPLVPAVLIISFQKPLIRLLVANYLSIDALGYYSIAMQIATLLSFVQFGLRMSWLPHLFEISHKENYGVEVAKIYKMFLAVTALICLILIANARLIITILATTAYIPAVSLIGFVAISNMLEILRQISGCGSLIAKKTKFDSLYEVSAAITTVLMFLFLYKSLGIIALALALLGGTLVKLVWSWAITQKFTDIRISPIVTVLVVGLLTMYATVSAMFSMSLLTGLVVTFLCCFVTLYLFRSNLYKYARVSFSFAKRNTQKLYNRS